MSEFDPRALRNAFGAFMTGVTVVTTKEPSGAPRGFTANSFTSVSLDPPLLLVCLGKNAATRPVFESAAGFAVNILSESQQPVAALFASKTQDRFAQVDWREGPFGAPLIDGAVAWFDCSRHQLVEAGDHIILIGRVEAFDAAEGNGLGYARGGYFSLGLEQSALSAASAPHLVVGAVVEKDGALLLEPDPAGGVRPPMVGGRGRPGAVSALKAHLSVVAPGAKLGPLYGVYENAKTGEHGVFYRAFAVGGVGPGARFHPLDALPLEDIRSAPIRSMVERFVKEHREQRFGVYFGDETDGEVRFLEP